jgi:hypothetical protein
MEILWIENIDIDRVQPVFRRETILVHDGFLFFG